MRLEAVKAALTEEAGVTGMSVTDCAAAGVKVDIPLQFTGGRNT